jgi:hypothetical protein
MKKLFDKFLVGIISTALLATLFIGINATNPVKAEDGDMEVALNNWTFIQGGQWRPSESGNEGYINSVIMNGTNEVIDGWLRGNGETDVEDNPSINQTQTAKQISTGFAIDIDNTGYDFAYFDEAPKMRNNPWSVQAKMKDIPVEKYYEYTISFKASASRQKYAYVV